MAATQPAAGTTWYRTSFELNLPKDQDTTLGLTIGDPPSRARRAATGC
jgi:hypothetical protein